MTTAEVKPTQDVGSVAENPAADERSACITVPLDPDRPTPTALAVATVVALQAGLCLDLVSVPGTSGVGGAEAFLRARVRESMGGGVERVCWTVVDSELPVTAVLDHAEAAGPALLCLATRSAHGLGHLIFGSVAESIVRDAPVPVLLAGPRTARPDGPYRRVLACVDGSEPSYRALTAATRLAAALDAELHLVEVIDPAVPLDDDLMEAVALERAAKALPHPPARAEAIHGAQADRAIVDHLRDDPRTIAVLGTHGRTGLRSVLLGSVALGVVSASLGPTLVVPPGARVDDFLVA
jgi:nucleotide-binding universal stress UspA family protein